MGNVFYSLCVALCAIGLAASAHADPVTYTWETQSSVGADNGAIPPPSLSLSFTVDGPVSVSANSHFADNPSGGPPAIQQTYPFPAALTAFDLSVGSVPGIALTLAGFVSPQTTPETGTGIPGFPQWSIDLNADPATETASLSFFFLNPTDSAEVFGLPIGFNEPFQISTNALGTIYYDQDGYQTLEPAQFTGMLVATPAVPEPRSLWVLMAGLGMLGLIIRRGKLGSAWT